MRITEHGPALRKRCRSSMPPLGVSLKCFPLVTTQTPSPGGVGVPGALGVSPPAVAPAPAASECNSPVNDVEDSDTSKRADSGCSSAPGSRAEAADWHARQWLIDNDLLDDTVGMTPEVYDRQPTRRAQRPMQTTIEIRSQTPFWRDCCCS
jgi:hypothetical protein